MLTILWYNTRFQLEVKSIINLNRIIFKILFPISLIFYISLLISVEQIVIDISMKLFVSLILLYFLFKNELNNYLKKS